MVEFFLLCPELFLLLSQLLTQQNILLIRLVVHLLSDLIDVLLELVLLLLGCHVHYVDLVPCFLHLEDFLSDLLLLDLVELLVLDVDLELSGFLFESVTGRLGGGQLMLKLVVWMQALI